MTKILQFSQQIYVVDYKDCTVENGKRGKTVYTCDTIDEAAEWLGQYETNDGVRFTIDGTPEAWHEQTGECGGSSICKCGEW